MSSKDELTERIERIRKRNEEIQKRHAEVEADKLQAKKENAMVVTKINSNFEDWPRAHKYDNIDFTYDNNLNNRHQEKRSPEQKDKLPDRVRKSQGFAEGDGPPPDPTYSFLRDAERDGEEGRGEQQKQGRNYEENQHWGTRDPTQTGQRGGRGRGGRGGFNRGRGNPRGGSRSNDQYDAWRCERNKIDEARINRQKNSEGKWRREWDNEKLNAENEINHAYKPEKPTLGDVLQVTSPPVIGSGRVGPRQMKPRPIFPSEEESEDSYASPIAPPHRPKLQHQQKQHNRQKQNTYQNKQHQSNTASDNGFSPNHSPPRNNSQQKQSQIKRPSFNGKENTKIEENNRKQQSPRKETSVQDRLNKFKATPVPVDDDLNGFTSLDDFKHDKPTFINIKKELEDVTAEIQGIYDSVENLNKKPTFEVSIETEIEQLEKCSIIALPNDDIIENFSEIINTESNIENKIEEELKHNKPTDLGDTVVVDTVISDV